MLCECAERPSEGREWRYELSSTASRSRPPRKARCPSFVRTLLNWLLSSPTQNLERRSRNLSAASLHVATRLNLLDKTRVSGQPTLKLKPGLCIWARAECQGIT